MLLKAFASGSAALTGVESISNGVTAFKPPQAQNAVRTLLTMAAVAISLFLGTSFLAVRMHALPSSTASVLSQIARGAFPAGSPVSIGYYLVQGFTFAILVLAANTSYQGFPRLAALLSRDGFFPRQFVNLGDRLVYSNGILILSSLAAALLLAFQANVNSLIHLYVIGVFTAFTLAQAGMVRYWQRTRPPGWRRRAAMNAVGALTTFVVDLIVIWTKFAAGAWMVTIAIPVLIACFYAIHRHYRAVDHRLARQGERRRRAAGAPEQVILYVERLDAPTHEALWYAQTISRGRLHAIHVPFAGSDTGIRPRFSTWTRRPDRTSRSSPPPRSRSRRCSSTSGASRTATATSSRSSSRSSSASRRCSRRCKGRAFSLKRGLIREPGLVVTDVPRLTVPDQHAWAPPTRTGLPRPDLERPRRLAARRRLRALTRLRATRPRSSAPSTRTTRRGSGATGAATRYRSRSRSSTRRSGTSASPCAPGSRATPPTPRRSPSSSSPSSSSAAPTACSTTTARST